MQSVSIPVNVGDLTGLDVIAYQFTVTFDEILKIVRIEISDNGKGISDQEKTKLFEPYFSTKEGGTGLGLPIAKKILEDHGGNIKASPNTPAGLKITIKLKKTKPGN